MPLRVRFHPHALERLSERGTTEAEVIATIEGGEQFAAKFGRLGFRRNFPFHGEWKGRHCGTKQVQAYAVQEDGWLVITVIVRYF
jgi:hypothetical protein